ncbi:MAG: hypothetical protein IJ435_01035 [Clostridia bacterium]|nr:hypothetical protein [Clostridia bacterium]
MSILGDILSSILSGGSKSPSEMSDRALKNKLNSSAGRNTGESISSRASYIREAQKRGIDHKKG